MINSKNHFNLLIRIIISLIISTVISIFFIHISKINIVPITFKAKINNPPTDNIIQLFYKNKHDSDFDGKKSTFSNIKFNNNSWIDVNTEIKLDFFDKIKDIRIDIEDGDRLYKRIYSWKFYL